GAQTDHGAARAERESLRAQAAALQSKLKDNEALIEKLQQSGRSNAQRAAEFQAAAKRPDLGEIAPIAAATASARSAPVVEIADFLPPPKQAKVPKPAGRLKLGSLFGMIGVGAVLIVLALVTYLLTRHPAEPAKAPVVAAAAAVPGVGTVLH